MDIPSKEYGLSAAIQSIGTANPIYCQAQSKVVEFMQTHLPLTIAEKRRLRMIYAATGVESRYSVLEDFLNINDKSFFSEKNEFPCTEKRMRIYKQHALPLAIDAINDCVKNHPQKNDILQKITHLITVSCTGMYAPGLDIDIIQHYKLPHTVHRTAVNFMGCYGVFNALKLANSICQSDENASVLIVSVEICSIHLQKYTTLDNLISSALFSDGAAATIVQSQASPGKKTNFKIKHFYCNLLPEGKKDMAWEIGNFGFEIGLTTYVANLIESGIAHFSKGLLDKLSLNQNETDKLLYAIHPGSKKILEACEGALNIPKEANKHSYHVLSKYGNMSSATILFVLKEIWHDLDESKKKNSIFCCGFGPGLTLESMLLEVNM